MTRQNGLSTKLCSFSDVVEKLERPELLEMAALGALVDWELVKLLEIEGWRLVRQSFSWKADEVLMVLKVIVDELPYVVFTSRSTPIGCMRTFCRKMREGEVRLYPDKYA